jgi:hypothetical protein
MVAVIDGWGWPIIRILEASGITRWGSCAALHVACCCACCTAAGGSLLHHSLRGKFWLSIGAITAATLTSAADPSNSARARASTAAATLCHWWQ